jgi:hypothetical protein
MPLKRSFCKPRTFDKCEVNILMHPYMPVLPLRFAPTLLCKAGQTERGRGERRFTGCGVKEVDEIGKRICEVV